MAVETDASRDLLKTLFGEDDDDHANQTNVNLSSGDKTPNFPVKRKHVGPLSDGSGKNAVGIPKGPGEISGDLGGQEEDVRHQQRKRASEQFRHHDKNETAPHQTFDKLDHHDNDNVGHEDHFTLNNDNDSPVASEAEEDDEDINMIFGSSGVRSTRRERSEHELRDLVNTLLARMEVATEQDRECINAKQPAIHKLRMLQEVKETLKNVDMHELLLRHGLMKVLANWLALLPDHTLPNVTVRTAVIDVISLLPIETDMVDRKEQLKNSGLGQIIMFLSQLPEETQANRTKCKKLVEKWSRPVYELTSHYGDLRRVEDERLGERLYQEPNTTTTKNEVCATEESDVLQNTMLGPKHGEHGFRHHAVVPEPEAMDYKLRPKLISDPNDIKARTQNADQQRVRKLVSKVARRKDGVKNGKAHLPSVEGRGMVTYH